MKNMIPSAIGTAIHTPVIPKSRGSSRIPPQSRPKVRRKDRTAETLPLERAVNRAEMKMLKPQKRKLTEKTGKPAAAIS